MIESSLVVIIHDLVTVRDDVCLLTDDELAIICLLDVLRNELLFHPVSDIYALLVLELELFELRLQLLHSLLLLIELDCSVSCVDFIELLLSVCILDLCLGSASL